MGVLQSTPAAGSVSRFPTPGSRYSYRNARMGSIRHARARGFDLHAGIVVPAGARDRLERLCRYALRSTGGAGLAATDARWQGGGDPAVLDIQLLSDSGQPIAIPRNLECTPVQARQSPGSHLRPVQFDPAGHDDRQSCGRRSATGTIDIRSLTRPRLRRHRRQHHRVGCAAGQCRWGPPCETVGSSHYQLASVRSTAQ